MAQGPCLNPSCKSNGQSHPNCRCYSHMAEGGVAAECKGPHKAKCVYYMAEGGAPQELPPDPEVSLTQAILHHGLSGVFQSTGQTKLANIKPEHEKPLHKAREHFTHVDVESGHPLVGQIPKHEREHVLNQLSPRVMGTQPSAEGFRSASDHIKSSYRGKQLMNEAVASVFNKGSLKLDNTDTKTLKEQAMDLSVNPAKALEIGGSLGHYMPEQAGQLGALTGAALSYIQAIKPHNTETGPFSEPAPVNKNAEYAYERQLGIVQQPLSVFKHLKDGSLIPQDVNTLKTVYPKMYGEMVSKVSEELINIKSDKRSIHMPYEKKMALSTFLGQPMDASLTPQSLLSIMKANAPSIPPQPQGKPKKQNGPTVTQMAKNADKYQTATQKAESDSK